MENASKALIIAGAILLSIAIIGVGMYVFQIASGATEDVGLQTEQAAAFNAKFDSYIGTGIRGDRVKTLVTTVLNHNNTNGTDADITVTQGSSSGTDTAELSTIRNAISNSATYTVTATYSTTNGYITGITIS